MKEEEGVKCMIETWKEKIWNLLMHVYLWKVSSESPGAGIKGKLDFFPLHPFLPFLSQFNISSSSFFHRECLSVFVLMGTVKKESMEKSNHRYESFPLGMRVG